jgi:hypothetical protein
MAAAANVVTIHELLSVCLLQQYSQGIAGSTDQPI